MPHLDAAKLIETVDRLKARIGERFPRASLLEIAGDLAAVAAQSARRAAAARRPQAVLRGLTWLLAVGMVGVLAYFIARGTYSFDNVTGWDLMQGVDAFISSIVFLGAAIVFLITLDRRVRRRRALAAIHELRVLAHVVDLHQLTKDPDRVFRKQRETARDAATGGARPSGAADSRDDDDHPAAHTGSDTASSPRSELTAFELNRYLDYCSEMLSLIGKICVLYGQDMDDEVVLAAVDDVESLTTGLSRKIWQKIMLLNSLVAQAEQGSKGT